MELKPRDLIADLRSRINSKYSATLGTESCERRMCADALEAQADEIDRLRADAIESDALREQLSGILRRTAVALRGPEPPLTLWGWHDLPDRAAAAIAEIDSMRGGAKK